MDISHALMEMDIRSEPAAIRTTSHQLQPPEKRVADAVRTLLEQSGFAADRAAGHISRHDYASANSHGN